MAEIDDVKDTNFLHSRLSPSTYSYNDTKKISDLFKLKAGHRIRDINSEFDDKTTIGQRIADCVAATMGSWQFIIAQSSLLLTWIVLNTVALIYHWDPYPFILLNLALSFQAAYAAPFIMMSQNRQAAKDRLTAQNDYEVNKLGEIETQAVLLHLEEQEHLMLEILHKLEQRASSTDSTVSSTAIATTTTNNSHSMEETYRHKIEADMWDSVNIAINKPQLAPLEVRDAMEQCYVIINIESFQRNSLLDKTYNMDEKTLAILKILFKETFISAGTAYTNPDREALEEVSLILQERMQHRNLDQELISKFAEITVSLLERISQPSLQEYVKAVE